MAVIEKSKKDAFRERFSKRFPDLNMDDEDSYYDKAGELMDENDEYKRNTDALRESIKHSPLMSELMMAARDVEGFDPVVWMVEQGQLDLDALQNDKDYAKKLGEAREKHLAVLSQQADIDKQVAENMPKTVDMVKQKQEELGLTDEQASEVVAQIYKAMDDLIVGIISPEQFEAQAKAMNYDRDMQAAHDEGVAQGLQTRVTDKLRSLDGVGERQGGRQMPMQERRPSGPRANNPFLANNE